MKDHPIYHTKAATKCKVSLPSHHLIFHLQKKKSKTWGPLVRQAHARAYTHTHSLTLQHARITSLMQSLGKTLPSPAKMKLRGVQQPVEIFHFVQIKICNGPKSSSPLKRTVSKQLTNPIAQNSSSVTSKSIKFSRKNVHQLKFLPKFSPVHN